MSLHMFSSEAQECVHAHVQSSLRLLQNKTNNNELQRNQRPQKWQKWQSQKVLRQFPRPDMSDFNQWKYVKIIGGVLQFLVTELFNIIFLATIEWNSGKLYI